jgi:hypothetical protein
MKVPVKWLKTYVDTDLGAAQIARRMTMAGLEAESIEQIASLLGRRLLSRWPGRGWSIPMLMN